jgi:hypothetical protein
VACESESNLRFEIGHVLFVDLVGYSKLLIEEQKERLRQLTDMVLATTQVREAPNEQLVRLPTGDGMALVFRLTTPQRWQSNCARKSSAESSRGAAPFDCRRRPRGKFSCIR